MSGRRELTIKKKVAALMTLAVVIIGVAAWFIIYSTERRDIVEHTRATLSRYAGLMVSSGEAKGLGAVRTAAEMWEKIYPDGRTTVISSEGEVLVDSKADPSQLENHYTRGEVVSAFETGEGFDMRYSKTLAGWQMYLAKRMTLPEDGGTYVVRLSYPVAKFSSVAKEIALSFLKYFAFALAAVWLGTYMLLRVIMKPLQTISRAAARIASGEHARFPLSGDREIQSLSNALNAMQDSLQNSLRESGERREELAQIVGALPVGVILIDDEKKIRYINKEAASICGRGRELPERGTSVEAVLPSHELFKLLDGPDTKKTVPIIRGGIKGEAEVTTLALPRGRMIVIQDLTEKLKLEEVRRDFFIDAGHEFRTPLAIIRTGLELLKTSPHMQDALCEEDEDTINSMIRQEERMSRLVDDLLLLVRLDSAPVKRAEDEVDIAGLLEDIKEEIDALPSCKDIDIEIAADPGLSVKGSLSELRRALLNVMENAHKYIEADENISGKIKVTAHAEAGTVVITVDDDGPGVPDEERELIFEKFRRGDSHRARENKKCGGYGLGLSISRRIIERHGGSLVLGQSKLGGAAFVATLPLALK